MTTDTMQMEQGHNNKVHNIVSHPLHLLSQAVKDYNLTSLNHKSTVMCTFTMPSNHQMITGSSSS